METRTFCALNCAPYNRDSDTGFLQKRPLMPEIALYDPLRKYSYVFFFFFPILVSMLPKNQTAPKTANMPIVMTTGFL